MGRGDFNNDGVADLAVGVPDETRRSVRCAGLSGCTTTDHPGAGAVNVIYGGAGGLTATGNQVVSQSIPSTSTNAHFGRALAAGTFRGPGFASDLAVGAPGVINGGAIYVHFSASGRLNATPNQTLFANTFSGAGTSFGQNAPRFPEDMAMVWGDFNGDGFGDLAAEVFNPGQTHENAKSAALVLYGSGSGFSTSNHTLLVLDDALGQAGSVPPGSGEACGRLVTCVTSRGHVGLAAGDLDGDGRHELLIGSAACRQVDDNGDALTGGTQGCIAIVPGRANRLDHFGWDVLLSDAGGTARFGVALAVDDFNGDGSKDIAAGAPEDDIDPGLGVLRAGSVRIFPGASACCISSPLILTQSNTGGSQVAEAGDRFGAAVAVNDFDGDGFSDLAVGSPGESTGSTAGHGVSTVFFGAGGGLPGPRTLNVALAPAFTFASAGLGSSMSAWNFGSTANADLTIGVPNFVIRPASGSDIAGAGAVLALYGQNQTGFTNPQLWTQDPGFSVCATCLRTSGRATAGNHFGSAVY